MGTYVFTGEVTYASSWQVEAGSEQEARDLFDLAREDPHFSSALVESMDACEGSYDFEFYGPADRYYPVDRDLDVTEGAREAAERTRAWRAEHGGSDHWDGPTAAPVGADGASLARAALGRDDLWSPSDRRLIVSYMSPDYAARCVDVYEGVSEPDVMAALAGGDCALSELPGRIGLVSPDRSLDDGTPEMDELLSEVGRGGYLEGAQVREAADGLRNVDVWRERDRKRGMGTPTEAGVSGVLDALRLGEPFLSISRGVCVFPRETPGGTVASVRVGIDADALEGAWARVEAGSGRLGRSEVDRLGAGGFDVPLSWEGAAASLAAFVATPGNRFAVGDRAIGNAIEALRTRGALPHAVPSPVGGVPASSSELLSRARSHANGDAGHSITTKRGMGL